MKTLPALLLLALAAIIAGAPGCATHYEKVTIQQPATQVDRPSPRPLQEAILLKPRDAETGIARVKQRLVEAKYGLPADEIGYYLDVQQAKLQQVGSPNVTIERAGERIVLSMPGPLNFESGSACLSPSAGEVLAQIGKVLFDYRNSLIVIVGHTDANGAPDINRRLSEERGLSVARALIDAGIDAERLVVIGQGADKPISPNDTPEGRAKNRRVELQLEALIKPVAAEK
jgi:outer membrane protein OmpA-like peptidoglycan-associated protein